MDRTTDGLEGVFAYRDDSRVGAPEGKRTSAIWRLFSMLWLPMVLQLT
jgi:hypothetical protein